MSKFVIEVTNRANQTGFVIDGEKEILFAVCNLNDDITRFDSHQLAKKFIDDKNLHQFGAVNVRTVDFVIRREKEIAKSASSADLFYLENEAGEKLFLNQKEQTYYFGQGESGFCVSKSKQQLENVIAVNKMEGKVTIKQLPKKNDAPNLKIVN